MAAARIVVRRHRRAVYESNGKLCKRNGVTPHPRFRPDWLRRIVTDTQAMAENEVQLS
jgi:hypothetical protein